MADQDADALVGREGRCDELPPTLIQMVSRLVEDQHLGLAHHGQKKLEALTGKTIALTARVQPGCLGGVRLEVEGTQLDGTVKNRLDEVRRLLAATL